jgi:phosphoribosylaminoimidazole-succinocarboxamide synthase
MFDRIAELSFALFARGTEVASERGLILVDTKYEFGVLGDDVLLIDEVHTPDSSRYWYADTYESLFDDGKDQRALDKEPLREWFVERGFRGDGTPPAMSDEVRVATAERSSRWQKRSPAVRLRRRPTLRRTGSAPSLPVNAPTVG